MIGKDFIFDGNAIPYSTAEGIVAGYLLDFDWTTPATRNNTQSRQDFHGTISSPTFAEGRLINVRGEIFDSLKADRGTIRKTIQDIFRLENFPTRDNQFKILQFTDDDGEDWFIRAKVYTLPEFTHERGAPIIPVSFQLYSEDSLIRSVELQAASGDYGLLGGIAIPVDLPTALSSALNSFEVTNNGNFASPATLTITVSDEIGVNQNIVQYHTDMNMTLAFGQNSNNFAAGYKFEAQESKLGAITVALGKQGSPTDSVRIALYSDDGGGLPNELLAENTIEGSSISAVAGGDYANLDIIAVVLDYDLSIGTDYHVVIDRTGNWNSSNYYRCGISNVDDGNSTLRTAGVWGVDNAPMYVKIQRPNSILNPKVYNLTDGKFFGVTGAFYKDDVLIFDTEERTAEVNDSSVLANRIAGSNWLFVNDGDNAFLLTGDNFDFAHQDQASLQVDYYHTRM